MEADISHIPHTGARFQLVRTVRQPENNHERANMQSERAMVGKDVVLIGVHDHELRGLEHGAGFNVSGIFSEVFMANVEITDSLYHDYLSSLLSGNKKRCVSIVQDLLRKEVAVYSLYEHLFQRALYEVGELWEMNRISVAVEHLATAITESLLNLVYPRIFAADHCGKKAIIACVANEYHQIGGKMVADILELHGWDGYFLGANTPPGDLLKLVDDKKPDLIGLSLAIHSNMNNLRRVVEMVRSTFRDIPILVGGQAFRWGGVDKVSEYEGVTYVASLKELEKKVL